MTGPNNPSAVYSRGQQVTIKYQRNNHGPGGFIRLTLVPVDQMMDKDVHERNAFHYGCWGANPVVATARDRRRNAQGFSIAGADGKLHHMPVSYYTAKVTIPTVVPDGVYALGWVWYGGLGGTLYQNVPANPYPRGLFSDYWSCAFVRIEGGSPMEQVFQPVFKSGMEKWWGDACKSANDAPGVCTYEPCIVNAKMQQPRPFKGGAKPKVLRPRDFLGTRSGAEPQLPAMVPEKEVLNDALAEIFKWKRKALGG